MASKVIGDLKPENWFGHCESFPAGCRAFRIATSCNSEGNEARNQLK
jgi:hypothetical protein